MAPQLGTLNIGAEELGSFPPTHIWPVTICNSSSRHVSSSSGLHGHYIHMVYINTHRQTLIHIIAKKRKTACSVEWEK